MKKLVEWSAFMLLALVLAFVFRTPMPQTYITADQYHGFPASIVPYDNLAVKFERKDNGEIERCWEHRGGKHELVRVQGDGIAVVRYVPPAKPEYFTSVYPSTLANYPPLPQGVIVAGDPRALMISAGQCKESGTLILPLSLYESETREYRRYDRAEES